MTGAVGLEVALTERIFPSLEAPVTLLVGALTGYEKLFFLSTVGAGLRF